MPCPARVDTVTRPPSRSIVVRTTSMPTPRPDRSVTSAAVEKLGAKIRSTTSASDMAESVAGRNHSAAGGDLANPRDIDARSIVLDFDHHPAALPGGPEIDRRGRRLARPRPLRRTFHAMIDRVAQHMKERLEERLHDRLVGFRRGAFDHQAGRLAQGRRHLAHQPGKALEGMVQGQNASG